jgi:ferredoxin-thioredoxin reductase catalytic subunit
MEEIKKTQIKRLTEEYREYAKKNGFSINPNKEIVEYLIKGLLNNEKKFGKKYCPCRREHNDKVVCPCAYHKKEIREQGNCHCFLFVK